MSQTSSIQSKNKNSLSLITLCWSHFRKHLNIFLIGVAGMGRSCVAQMEFYRIWEEFHRNYIVYIFPFYIISDVCFHFFNEILALKNSISSLTIKEDKGTILWDNGLNQSGEKTSHQQNINKIKRKKPITKYYWILG